jgi:methyltransferase (TIGR00027 family)
VEHDGPSTTARRVAAHRRTFTRRSSSPGGRPGDDDALARDVAADTTVEHGRMHRYLARRTTFFDAVVVGAIDDGLRQIVVLGAGYDARSLRYARDGIAFFEVDLPGTQRDKLERLARLGAAHADVTYLAVDLGADGLGGWLAAGGHDGGVASLFVLEGVVPYLAVEVLTSLCTTLRRRAAPGSLFALSIGVARRDGDTAAAGRAVAFRARVAAVGEPVRTTLGPDAGAALLDGCGWEVLDATDPGWPDEALAARHRDLGFLLARAARPAS